MTLYYCTNPDNRYRFVVRAAHPWQARTKAHNYMLEQHDIDIPVTDWDPVVCTEPFIVGEVEF